MRWMKKGVVFTAEGNSKGDWMLSHAQIPVPDMLDDGVLRIYFGTRDRLNRTSTTYVEVEADNPSKVIYVHDRPVLSPGRLGAFDDSGAMPSCIVTSGRRKYLYYIGWNVRTTVRYHNSIGLAVSDDGGRTFTRLYEGPIMDRTFLEPYFVVTPYVIVENGVWKMWYCGCSGWYVENGITEPRYQIKYAESLDGIRWTRDNRICIPYGHDKEANARACVIKDGQMYRMWYCYRSISSYRTEKDSSYRLGYAESTDGVNWMRRDEDVGIDRSEDGWDSQMLAYPYVYQHKGRKYMLYNGNGFGRSGFGYAILDES